MHFVWAFNSMENWKSCISLTIIRFVKGVFHGLYMIYVGEVVLYLSVMSEVFQSLQLM